MLALCFAVLLLGQEVYGHPSRIRETCPPEQPVGHYLGAPSAFLRSLSLRPAVPYTTCLVLPAKPGGSSFQL